MSRPIIVNFHTQGPAKRTQGLDSTRKQTMAISKDKYPVEVYCRVRPLEATTKDKSCVSITGHNTVQVTPPEASQGYRTKITKATQQYEFTEVFDESVPQNYIFQTVVMPLVEDLLHGKNSLVFAYGASGSGKTHTMNGKSQDGGIIPRCLDAIFNSIEHQNKKSIFKPDGKNGFDIQSDVDAKSNGQGGKSAREFKAPRHRERQDNYGAKILDVNVDKTYSVFVTFVEIYNNMAYDLLEDINPGKKEPKMLREDKKRKMMYVHPVTELEIKTAGEAAAVFARGQRNREIARTRLNSESSRGHSVFNIRVVQASIDNQGSTPEKSLKIGHLSLVDLAGSERNSGTNTSDKTLREAGSINNTLMNLRTCIETLRDNQMNATPKMIPYRESKIAQLFKGYFDGEGKVRMIICVNPRADGYDDTKTVMRFAQIAREVRINTCVVDSPTQLDQVAQEVLITRAAQPALQFAELVPEAQIARAVQPSSRAEATPVGTPVMIIDRSNSFLDEAFLEPEQKRYEQAMKKRMEERTLIGDMEEELAVRRAEVISLKAEVKKQRSRAQSFENRLRNAESIIASLQRQVAELPKLGNKENQHDRQVEAKLQLPNYRSNVLCEKLDVGSAVKTSGLHINSVSNRPPPMERFNVSSPIPTAKLPVNELGFELGGLQK